MVQGTQTVLDQCFRSIELRRAHLRWLINEMPNAPLTRPEMNGPSNPPTRFVEVPQLGTGASSPEELSYWKRWQLPISCKWRVPNSKDQKEQSIQPAIALYFIGDSPEDSLLGPPFDEADGADMAKHEQGYAHLYSVDFTIDASQRELCESRYD